MIGYFSLGIGRIPHLSNFLNDSCRYVHIWHKPEAYKAIVGWGLKKTSVRARNYAIKHGIPYISLEDGFLRSIGLGVAGVPPISLVIDQQGIYYDARTPSDLEVMIREIDLDHNELLRAEKAIETFRRFHLTKYNHVPYSDSLQLGDRKAVLVVDQTAGDASIACGLATGESFLEMFHCALDENPGSQILLKTHPDVVAGKKKGHLLAQAQKHGCRIIADANPWSVLEKVDKVYVVTSQMGFEALLANKDVRCFGVPFYSGWGLTEDQQTVSRRSVERTIEQVFYAAYIQYSRYIDPVDGSPCSLETVLGRFTHQLTR